MGPVERRCIESGDAQAQHRAQENRTAREPQAWGRGEKAGGAAGARLKQEGPEEKRGEEPMRKFGIRRPLRPEMENPQQEQNADHAHRHEKARCQPQVRGRGRGRVLAHGCADGRARERGR